MSSFRGHSFNVNLVEVVIKLEEELNVKWPPHRDATK